MADIDIGSGNISRIRLKEGAAASTPASGYVYAYAKTDGYIYTKDDAGTEQGPFALMVGDSGSGGTVGLVPAAGAGDAAALKYLKANGTWAVIAEMTGDSGAGGTSGLAPAPGAGDAAALKYLKADATWAVIAEMTGDSGAGGTSGLVPAPGAGDAAAGKFLKADATWEAPSGGGGGGGVNLIPNANFDVWENGTSVSPDAWTLTGAGATVARSTTTKVGLYSAAVTRTGNDCHLSQNIYVPMGSTYIRSREMTMAAWVYATVADRARLRVTDGVDTSYSTYHTGDSSWQLLTVTFTPGAAVSQLTVGGAVDTGNTTAYFDCFTIAEGTTVTYASPGLIPFSAMPLRAHRMLYECIHSTTIAYSVNSTHINCYVAYQATPADGNYFTCSVWLAAGTYTMYMMGSKDTTQGKLDIYIDGVVAISGQDWYNGVLAVNTIQSGSVSVVGDGNHVVKVVVNGKNVSSSNYYYVLTSLWFAPGAD